MRGKDLNLRPSGYEPDELPGCSTPRDRMTDDRGRMESSGVGVFAPLGRRGCFLREGFPSGDGASRVTEAEDGGSSVVCRLLSVVCPRLRRGSVLGGPGGDRLSRAFWLSTMGAGGFNGRVRNGIGFCRPRFGPPGRRSTDDGRQTTEDRRSSVICRPFSVV